jgi:hypothetical protein
LGLIYGGWKALEKKNKWREGKPVAVRKRPIEGLLPIIYGVLKHQKPFDPEYLKKHEKSA